MAVLVEAISVVVRRDAIDDRYSGGWREFLNCIPNCTFCADEELARVGFMSPSDVESFVKHLESCGLTFLRNGLCVDIAIVDQRLGPTMPVEWLEFAQLSLSSTGNKVAVCWLFEGPKIAAGIHMPSLSMTIATPNGWTYENSLSANSKFITAEEEQEKLKFLRHDNDMDVYLDLSTGKEVYLGRSNHYDAVYKRGSELILPHIELLRCDLKVTTRVRDEVKRGIQDLDEVTTYNPKNWAAFWIKGKGYQLLGDQASAYSEFKTSYGIQKDNPDVAREYAASCLELGHGEYAVEAMQHAIGITADDAGLYANLALAFLISGKYQEATVAIESSLKMSPYDEISQAVKKIVDEVVAGNRSQPKTLADICKS